ncbi:hypothetical protein ACIBH1_40795 [Nonomuraea sp. NPDC050663]|uniref:hypothetical protein n=1 Tax=Nonomuraea sp. NPDC050663 TaxID=3364370 RepID=UPI00378CC83D
MSRADICDLCDLPDPYNGQGDGIASCECPRGDCGAPDWSVFCTCPTEDDGPACWDLAPGGGTRCSLDDGHEEAHSYTIWSPPEPAKAEPS